MFGEIHAYMLYVLTGFHRGDGVFGAIIIRQPMLEDPNHGRFDYDLPQHVLMVGNILVSVYILY